MPVPKDCVKTIGKTEVVISLKTRDPSAAKVSAERMKALWTERFKQAREGKVATSVKHSALPQIALPPHEENVGTFRQDLIDQMDKNLPRIFEKETENQLLVRFNFHGDCISPIENNSQTGLDLPEIGISWPINATGHLYSRVLARGKTLPIIFSSTLKGIFLSRQAAKNPALFLLKKGSTRFLTTWEIAYDNDCGCIQ